MKDENKVTRDYGTTKGGHEIISFEVLAEPVDQGIGRYPHMYRAEVFDKHPKQNKKVTILYDTLGRCNNPLRDDLYIDVSGLVKSYDHDNSGI